MLAVPKCGGRAGGGEKAKRDRLAPSHSGPVLRGGAGVGASSPCVSTCFLDRPPQLAHL